MFQKASLQRMFLALSLTAAVATGQTGQPPAQSGGDFSDAPLEKIPADVIIVKGAEPSASDRATPLPEDGGVSHGVYRNRYLQLSYPLPEGWAESFDGPPPSERGEYVLAQLVASKGTMLVSARDMFFAHGRGHDAVEMVSLGRQHLPSYYRIEREPQEIEIGGRTFIRYDYMSPDAGLHWAVLATEIRCHALQFVFTTSDTQAIESLIKQMEAMQLPATAGARSGKGGGDVPLCIANYATPKNLDFKVEPVFDSRHFNAIPVRIIIDKKGAVRHVHVISAFPEQAQKITEALLQWRFKPYERDGQPVEVETGILFGARDAETSDSHVD